MREYRIQIVNQGPSRFPAHLIIMDIWLVEKKADGDITRIQGSGRQSYGEYQKIESRYSDYSHVAKYSMSPDVLCLPIVKKSMDGSFSRGPLTCWQGAPALVVGG